MSDKISVLFKVRWLDESFHAMLAVSQPELVAELGRGLVSRGIAGCDVDKMLVSHLRWIMWELKKLGLDGGAKFTVVRAETWLSEQPD